MVLLQTVSPFLRNLCFVLFLLTTVVIRHLQYILYLRSFFDIKCFLDKDQVIQYRDWILALARDSKERPSQDLKSIQVLLFLEVCIIE